MVAVTDNQTVDTGRVDKFDLTRFIFLRAVALVYVIAFASLLVQIIGLIGHDGILPAERFLPNLKQALLLSDGGSYGGNPYLICPTIFWLAVNDPLLTGTCVAGIITGLLALSGVTMRADFVILWILYRSLIAVGGDFLSFQWDILLLETGFLCIFWADGALLDAPWPRSAATKQPAEMKSASHIVLWLLRLLLFKLMFLSGLVKLKSEDPTWWNLTALDYHYWTQPLPTPLAWYAAQFPQWWQKLSTGIMFFIEIVVPFMIFGPRLFRRLAAIPLVGLQLLIATTGNYTFFNFLTMSLCLTLLDDDLLARALPKSLVIAIQERCRLFSTSFKWNRISELSLAALIGTLNLYCLVPAVAAIPPVALLVSTLQPLELVNRYGLFASMTTTRH
ncbi:MAG TPA: lipase maturation factor family protein, partial [Chroococcales cyanobacterium]